MPGSVFTRHFLIGLLLAWIASAQAFAAPIRLGISPAFLHDRHALLGEWKTYLERQLGQEVAFVLRDSYRDMLELVSQGKLDAAWLCDCPYVTANPALRLIATPVFRGRPYYQAYLIVPARDVATRGMADLKGKVFAYADPYSNAGHLSAVRTIEQLGHAPDRYFRRTFFTWSHRRAIEAVATGMADAATVSSYIWETLDSQASSATTRTRVVARSEEYGFPPLVAGASLTEAGFANLRRVFLDMSRDEEGRGLLRKMNLDGFTPPQPAYYQRSREMLVPTPRP
jgi:phosphonate transport system substrate-binding protein